MSVQTQINRLGAAKAALVASIEAKGVEVPESVLLDALPPYIDMIEAGPIPPGYTKLPYIRSSGKQYIDTGYIPNQNTRVLCSAVVKVSDETNWLYGARQSSKARGFGFAASQNGYYNATYNTGSKAFSTDCNSDGVILVDQNKATATVTTETTTETVTGASGTFTAPVSLTLFAGNTNGTLACGSVSIYSCRIYDNDVLVRDFIPCLRESDDEIGLFDMKNSVFFPNDGEGRFYTESGSSFPEKDTFENMGWADIQTVCKAGKATEFWAIGDQKEVTIGSSKFLIDIIGFDHDDVTDPTAYGRSKAGITCQVHKTNASTYKMNSLNSNIGGWQSTIMRTETMETFFSNMETGLSAVIVAVNKLSGTGSGNVSTLVTTSDKLFLLAGSEYFGPGWNALNSLNEGAQYAYYAAGNSAYKQKNGTTTLVDHWTRTANNASGSSNDTTQFVCVKGTVSATYGENASKGCYIAPAFCI